VQFEILTADQLNQPLVRAVPDDRRRGFFVVHFLDGLEGLEKHTKQMFMDDFTKSQLEAIKSGDVNAIDSEVLYHDPNPNRSSVFTFRPPIKAYIDIESIADPAREISVVQEIDHAAS